MFDSFHGAGGNSHLDPVHPRTGTGGNDDPVRSESVGIAPIQICAEPHIDAQAIDFRLLPKSVIADPLMPGSQRRDPHLAAKLGGRFGENDVVSPQPWDRKSVVSGKRWSVRVDLGGRRMLKKKKNKNKS